ncbi:MAG: DUF502 domain-containing protein [Deltaproteobacteria bacterium]|nr:DUF502 domain-containing protein [Deltaproteobacteria bacterium]
MKKFLKQSFMAGVLTLLPIAGTIWLLKALIFTAEEFSRSFIPARWHPEQVLGRDIPGIGLLIALILILLTGTFTRFYLGRKLVEMGDRLFDRIPLGRGIYKAIKQFLNTVAGESEKSFRRVVLVEFPSPGSFVIGFVTGTASGEVQDKTEERVLNVFVPTTPNPTTGFFFMMPERKLTPLSMPVDEAFKLIVSGGVVVKESLEKLPPQP